MIKLFTSLEYFKPEEIIIDNESFFYNIPIDRMPEEFNQIIEEVDSAKLIDARLGTIVTPLWDHKHWKFINWVQDFSKCVASV